MSHAASPLAAAGPLVERESGLVVPAHLAGAPEEPDAATAERKRADGAVDPDGRRRIVLTKETRKRFSALARDLALEQLGVIVWCRTKRQVPREVVDATTGAKGVVMIEEDIPGACGEVMLREDEGGEDPGYGCKCTRIHFLRGATPNRRW